MHQLVNMYRVRGHLIANLDPLGRRPPHTHPELDVNHYGLSIWDLDREFPAGGLGSGALGRKTMPLRDILGILRDAYSRTIGVEYMHIQEPEQKDWIQARVETTPVPLDGAAAAADPRAPERGGGLRGLHPHEVPRPEAVQPRRRGVPHPDARHRCSTTLRRPGMAEVVLGTAHRGRLNVLVNTIGKSYAADLPGVRGRPRPRVGAGLGRRQVPRRLGRDAHHPVGQEDRRDPGVEPQPPRSGRPSRRRDGSRQGGPARRHHDPLAGASRPRPR